MFINTTGGRDGGVGATPTQVEGARAAGLKRRRSTPAPRLLDDRGAGIPADEVKAYTGHADIATTMIYVHHVPQHDAADRLSHLVDAAEDPLQESVSPTASRTEPISGDLTGPDTA